MWKRRQKTNADIKSSVENPKVEELLKTKYPGLYEFSAYPDFVNPFATYTGRCLFQHWSENTTKQLTCSKNRTEWFRDNAYVADDLVETEANT